MWWAIIPWLAVALGIYSLIHLALWLDRFHSGANTAGMIAVLAAGIILVSGLIVILVEPHVVIELGNNEYRYYADCPSFYSDPTAPSFVPPH